MVYIEKEYIDDKRFSPVITDYIRKKGCNVGDGLRIDILVEDKKPCPCGLKLMRIKKIEGRMDDVFLLPTSDGGEMEVYPDFISRVMVYVPTAAAKKALKNAKVLIVASELASAGLIPERKETFELFSDGAVAKICRAGQNDNEIMLAI